MASEIVQADTKRVVGLVPCAVGGSTIMEWQKSYSETSNYLKCLKKVLAASATGTIRSLFFLQGEGDAEGGPGTKTKDWDIYFQKYLSDLKKDLKMPNLSVVYGQIKAGALPHAAEVQRAQERVAGLGREMFETEDLLYAEDNLHFTTKSQEAIGKRMAQALLSLERQDQWAEIQEMTLRGEGELLQ